MESNPEENKIKKYEKKKDKGYRVVLCPQCKHPYFGKFLVKIVSCDKCKWFDEAEYKQGNNNNIIKNEDL